MTHSGYFDRTGSPHRTPTKEHLPGFNSTECRSSPLRGMRTGRSSFNIGDPISRTQRFARTGQVFLRYLESTHANLSVYNLFLCIVDHCYVGDYPHLSRG